MIRVSAFADRDPLKTRSTDANVLAAHGIKPNIEFPRESTGPTSLDSGGHAACRRFANLAAVARGWVKRQIGIADWKDPGTRAVFDEHL